MDNTGPTVKSLDERVDSLEETVHSEIADLKEALTEQSHQFDLKLQDVKAVVTLQIAGLRNELELFKADLKKLLTDQAHHFEMAIEGVKAANALQIAGLRGEMELFKADLKQQLSDQAHRFERDIESVKSANEVFKKEVTNSLNFAKWLGAFAATIIVALIGFGWSFSSANGELRQKVENLSKQVEEIKQVLNSKNACPGVAG